MKILITGSTGYIGGNIRNFLQSKHMLLTPAHNELDLLDEEKTQMFFQKHPVDLVIHCAVVGGSRKEEYEKGMFYDNVRIFFNLARCQKFFKRMINIGSGAEYDKRYPIINVKEDDLGKRIPEDEYGFFKYVCANYINQVKHIVDLRVFGMFGKGEDYRYRFISNAICRHLLGLPITIGQDVYFDYMDIMDFMKIIEYFVHHAPKHPAYNIGTGKKINLWTIADKINMIAGEKREIIVKKPGLNNEYTCNASRLFREIKSLKLTPFDASLKRLYLWYKARKDTIDPSVL